MDDEGLTPLQYAVESGKADLVKYLLGRNAEVNSKNLAYNSPLHTAALLGDLEILKLLLEAEAKVNRVNVRGETPLLLAASKNHWEVVKLLLQRLVELPWLDIAAAYLSFAVTVEQRHTFAGMMD